MEYFKVADDVVGMIKLELGKRKISDTLYIFSYRPHLYGSPEERKRDTGEKCHDVGYSAVLPGRISSG